MLLCVFLLSPYLPGTNDVSITVLDVGQGLCAVVASGDKTVLVDCGSNSGENAGEIAHEFLTNRGRTSVDLIVLTHFHADHVNGVEFILSRMHVAALAIPDPEGAFLADSIISLARKRGTEIIYVMDPVSVTLDDVEIVLFPPYSRGDENERCLAVLCRGAINALITGDMNAAGERSLLRNADLPALDLLIVGHHGSRHSTSAELLSALTPALAVVPVGYNSYGHPANETLERLEQFAVPVYRTDEAGHVTITR